MDNNCIGICFSCLNECDPQSQSCGKCSREWYYNNIQNDDLTFNDPKNNANNMSNKSDDSKNIK